MTESSTKIVGRRWRAAWIAGSLVALVAVVLLWYFTRPGDGPVEVAESEIGPSTEQFFVGISALDVEENQRAAECFQDLTEKMPREPAMWANLGVARLRLNEIDAAKAAADRAAELASSNTDITVLQALVAERLGRIDEAVEKLKSVDSPDIPTLYRLAELLEQTGLPESERERLEVLDRIQERSPENRVVQFERARLAARLEDAMQLADSLAAISTFQTEWSEASVKRFAAAQSAFESGIFRDAARELTFLQNLNMPGDTYQQSLLELGISGGSIGSPMREFLSGSIPGTAVAESDRKMRFVPKVAADAAAPIDLFVAVPVSGASDSSFLSVVDDNIRFGTSSVLQLPSPPVDSPLARQAILYADINSDFKEDIVFVGADGLSLWLQETEAEPLETEAEPLEIETRVVEDRFQRHVPSEEQQALLALPGESVWALDFDIDGDLDLLIANTAQPCRLLRNNGDMTFAESASLAHLNSTSDVLWMDVDRDGDGDVVTLDDSGGVWISWNERGGRFTAEALALKQPAVAIAGGDVDHDGEFDIVVLDRSGGLQRVSFPSGRQASDSARFLQWSDPPALDAAMQGKRVSLWLADMDNNGGVDILASAADVTALWLNDLRDPHERVDGVPEMFVTAVTDVDGDGRLDLVGMQGDAAVVATNQGTKDYHWQTLQLRANPHPGDQRMNTFGLGGRVEVRAGLLLQASPIVSGRTHFGLGEHEQAGVARIVWPNGTIQAEFDLSANQLTTAEQRLKGSCPFVFARSGSEITFVKDFIWRSPLGLKINSQETAGVTQTEDRIKIPGELLSVSDGCYEVRITADLWETHFFDHISMRVVDHLATEEVFVDERFTPAASPNLSTQVVRPPQPYDRVRDEGGRDMGEQLSAIDGVYVDSFPLGRFQGIAEDHWVEFRLADDVPLDGSLRLVGHGYVYPTDSSLNVAMSQGDFPRPQGLVLEMQGADGQWRSVTDDLGFPAGKNKTVLLPVPTDALAGGARNFRLRTNLEVYWDFLGWTAVRSTPDVVEQHVETVVAELRYRGFSEMSPLDRRRPDLPRYQHIAKRGQRWLDLEGYYTRFGDVRELLSNVDDRYVIMNAGDEMILRFAAPPPPKEGWTRDFVLVGDGWVKDGDLNTTDSATVHPLPSHEVAEPQQHGVSLFDDPVFKRHERDWHDFHTRFVKPHQFRRGLWGPARVGQGLGGSR